MAGCGELAGGSGTTSWPPGGMGGWLAVGGVGDSLRQMGCAVVVYAIANCAYVHVMWSATPPVSCRLAMLRFASSSGQASTNGAQDPAVHVAVVATNECRPVPLPSCSAFSQSRRACRRGRCCMSHELCTSGRGSAELLCLAFRLLSRSGG